jgi:dolichyl-diphosphooligosaccharide--protein glycosyltransferase
MVQAGTKKSQITKINSKAGINSLIIFVVLLLAWIAGFSSRLFAVIRFESIIHEFDPW